MKYLTIVLISIGMMTGIAFGAGQIPEKLLIATGNYNGPSARALGLGGTYTASRMIIPRSGGIPPVLLR
jgi:hypothetical protein